MDSKTHFIGNQWLVGQGDAFESTSPVDNSVLWQGALATESEIDSAFESARSAFEKWCDVTIQERISFCKKFAQLVKDNSDEFAQVISREMGKPLWESKTEVGAVAGKIDLSIEAYETRRGQQTLELGAFQAVTRFKPFGVVGVLGPFNLPAHLPNGHIVPAILAGNTVVFKPSEQTPAVAQYMMELWQKADLPAGVINMVQGGRDCGIGVVNHPQLDGIFFTGSSAAGVAINKSLAANPQKIVALEMGGNNPLIVHQCDNLEAAAYTTILSAYITSGQRCTCARRLYLVDDANADKFLGVLAEMIGKIRVGFPSDESEPFMGTVIAGSMGQRILQSQDEMIRFGCQPIVKAEKSRGCDALISPGLLDATGAADQSDEEVFGPILRVSKVASFEQAISEANNTRYGLAAGLLSDSPKLYKTFIRKIRAGVVNWNRQTTGASGKLPFGGCGLSGNHRPSGYYAADYCSWPVASLESTHVEMPEKPMTGIEL